MPIDESNLCILLLQRYKLELQLLHDYHREEWDTAERAINSLKNLPILPT